MLATSSSPQPFPPPHTAADNNAIASPSDLDREHEQRSKRTYLGLLPPAQIIELCLAFEKHVPVDLRKTLWPIDIEAAILALKTSPSEDAVKVSSPTPQQIAPPVPVHTSQPVPNGDANVTSQQVHPPGTVVSPPVQPTSSSYPTPSPTHDQSVPLTSAPTPVIAQDPAQSSTTTSPVPQPSALEPSQTHATSIAAEAAPAAQPPPTTSQASAPESQAQTQPQQPGTQPQVPHTSTPPVPAPPHLPYPYAPYAYAPQPGYPSPGAPQAAYPHAPYYVPPPVPAAGYTQPYPNYGHYPPQAQAYPPTPHQPAPGPSSEDLPSYEDMIVEALTEIKNPEGAAPKDIFAWIGSRWPLQINFRPSASQALQKAFKRGRLEKGSGGRYRLNPNWEGGATSKRTTRRPQTLAQTTYAHMHPPPPQTTQNAASPFTHAPLPHRAHPSPPPAPQHQPYPGYAFPYPYPSYPGYPAYHHPTPPPSKPAAAKTTTASKTASKTVTSSGKDKDKENVTDDAWEAAQHILQAINFGSLQTTPKSNSEQATSSGSGVPSMMASLDFIVNLPTGEPSTTAADLNIGEDGLGRVTLTDEERASLQAQLALLAAQLSEIANDDEDEDDEMDVTDAEPTPPEEPQAVQSAASTSVVMDVNQFPDSTAPLQNHQPVPPVYQPPPVTAEPLPLPPPPPPPSVDVVPVPSVPSASSAVEPITEPADDMTLDLPEEESDEDEDMEMVDVDSYMRNSGLRT